jgi:hypothetical protein
MPEVAQQNDKYQVRVVGRVEGQETNNVLHFSCASGAGDADVALHLITVLLQCYITHLLPVLTSKWSLEKAVWKRVAPTLGPELVTVPTGTTSGGGSANALPSFAAGVISLKSILGGRSHRGRMYIAGIPETATTDSFLNAADPFWTAMLAFANCIVSNFIIGDPVGTNSWQMMIYSRKLGGAHFPYGNAGFTAIKEVLPNQLVGTMRSRKVGRGS